MVPRIPTRSPVLAIFFSGFLGHNQLCSGLTPSSILKEIIPDRTQATIWDVRDPTSVGHIQDTSALPVVLSVEPLLSAVLGQKNLSLKARALFSMCCGSCPVVTFL